MMGDAATAAVGGFACPLGSSIETGPGEAGERVYSCRGCVPHYLHYKFRSSLFQCYLSFCLILKCTFIGLCLMMGNAAMAAVGSFACLPGSSFETGPGEPGERVYCCRVCVPH